MKMMKNHVKDKSQSMQHENPIDPVDPIDLARKVRRESKRVPSLKVLTIKRVFETATKEEQLEILSSISPVYDYVALDMLGLELLMNANTRTDPRIALIYMMGEMDRLNCPEKDALAIKELLDPTLNNLIVLRNASFYDAREFLEELSLNSRDEPFSKEPSNISTTWFAKHMITMTNSTKVIIILYFDDIPNEATTRELT